LLIAVEQKDVGLNGAELPRHRQWRALLSEAQI
jgi:hypothetical protein